jgi:LuxR family maltose regulon positive regulatory protein
MADATSLLATKLFMPPVRAALVPRPRLTARFTHGLARPLTLVSAPAGSGKTTLLSEWRSERVKAEGERMKGNSRITVQPSSFSLHPSHLAWLSLDADDNDPARFLAYLTAAVAQVRPGFGGPALALLRSSQPPAAPAILAHLIQELCALGEALVLVLDDYHLITAQAVHDGLTYLLDHMPAQLRLVILTRADPPLPLARLRARDQLSEIRAGDLRFTAEEAAAFLNQVMGLSLAPADVAALEARTEGWIAGLQLAALSMQGHSDITAFVKAFTGSHLYISEYLVEEVLQRQPEAVQRFLLRTSILERLNGALCEAVAGLPDGEALLMTLHRANLFVVPLDDAGQWFRYHHLFADLLQARLRQSLPAGAVAALHQRAAAWYEQHGLAAEAFAHALAAADFDHAARLVEAHAYRLMTSGELATCLQWMAALPETVAGQRPLLLVIKAWAFTFSGSIHQVEPALRQAEALIQLEPDSPTGREVRGNAAGMRAFFAMLAGDFAPALELAERAEALLPEGGLGARSLLPYTRGAALRAQGQYEQAARAFAENVQMGEAADNLLIWATGITEIVNTRRMQGRLCEAAEVGRQALQRLAERGVEAFGSLAKIEVALCEVLRERNGLEETRTRLGQVLARMQAWDMPTDRLFAHLGLIRALEAQGDVAGALEHLRVAKELRDAHPVLAALAHNVDMAEIRLALAAGQVAQAARRLEDLRPGTHPLVQSREQQLIMLARVRLAQGRSDDAATVLEALAADAAAGDHKAALIETLALLACARQAQGESGPAVRVLIEALALAEPEGFVRVFVDQGDVMQSLLIAAARRLTLAADDESIRLKAYSARLLDAFQPGPGTGPAPNGSPPTRAAAVVEPLTPRELEILQLVAAGDSNRAIAEKLVITVSAVKKHTGNIFGKLGVNSRTQAVARARELGLL